jgi:putative AdoMet-dependent methyltransferase
LLQGLALHHLSVSGRIVIGDIAFLTAQDREQTRARWTDRWDENEHYWVADEAIVACKKAGIQAVYTQVSSCGGVFVIEPMVP